MNRFDDYIDVDCNNCQNYWNETCDGVQVEDRERPCQSFRATRTIDIPKRLSQLEDELKITRTTLVTLYLVVLLQIIGGLFT